jgi:hypothetical protein
MHDTIKSNRAPHATKEDLNLFLEHLVNQNAADFVPELVSGEDFVSLDDLNASQTLNAQLKTSDWLKSLSEDDDGILSDAQEKSATDAFNALVTDSPDAKNKVLALEVPEEIRSIVGMVTAYQWKFVEQAQELRSMAVTKIVKDTDHPDARIRLKALEMLGKVTEVALFTERVQVKTEDISDEELEKRIKEKLGRYMGKADVVDVTASEVDD